MPGEGLSSYIDLLSATYPFKYKGLDDPSELKESSSKLNIRDVAERVVAEVESSGET
jgi:hypothetical protein